MNTGYIGQQLDLYLVHHNIGTLWFGIGKPDIDTFEGLLYKNLYSFMPNWCKNGVRKKLEPNKQFENEINLIRIQYNGFICR